MATGVDSDKCLQTHSWLHFGQVTKFPTKQHSSNSHGSSYSPNYQHSDQSDYIARPSRVKPMKKKKRRRAAPPHSPHKLSRRYQINKRMRALRNLIPNCTKMDKESILDEAIYYLKSLQLQLQIMPTFGGLCVPVPVPTPTSLGASSLQMFGLPLAGYGTRLQMPINPLPPQQLCRSTI